MPTSVGIDLASQNQKTAVCVIYWGEAQAAVERVEIGATQQAADIDWLVDICSAADAVGIDAPFGWPAAMVDAITSWADGGPWPDAAPRDLRLRRTDQAVYDETGLTPLSVSSDRIAIVAWRCAALLSRLAGGGGPLDRVGADGVYEVYPAAALACWGLDRAGYKSRGAAAARKVQRDTRRKLVASLVARVPWLDISNAHDLFVQSDDALDALIASLVTRAAVLGKTLPIPADDSTSARREGWIHLPEHDALDSMV
jgi:predicted nuclease with RNAse H fold